MSDVIPTDSDERIGDKIFVDGESNHSPRLIAYEVARHRRVLRESGELIGDLVKCIKGDEATGYKGLQQTLEETRLQGDETHTMVCQIYKKETGKEPPSESHALERKKKEDPFVERLKGVILFVAWLVTTVLAALAILL